VIETVEAPAQAAPGTPSRWSSVLRRWERFWFQSIPPHSYALLRIAFGAIGILSLVGLTPVELYWPLDAITPLPGEDGIRGAVANAGLGRIAGYAAFALLLVSFTAMTVGYQSDIAVLLCLVGVILQHHLNRYPLSSAHVVMVDILFCLIWTHTGRVWSLDALGKRRVADAAADDAALPIWPLRLVMFQVAVIYGCSGLWKFAYSVWRGGTAAHWAINLNSFHRFPWPLPADAAPLMAALTWFTLAFELLFPVLVWFRRTRPLALVLGVFLHLGLFFTLELGPFSLLMIASYIAFLDPYRMRERVARFTSLRQVASFRRELCAPANPPPR
jgi:hypothetical protein